MSYSATTGKLGLPQWVKGTKDHPDFLTDMNQAFEKIDGFAERTDNTVDGLPEQVDELAALVESMQEDVGEHTTELASLGLRVGIQENNVANLDLRVGNLVTRIGDAESNIESIQDELNARKVHAIVKGVVATNSNGDSITVTVSRHDTTLIVGGLLEQIIPLWDSMSRDYETVFYFDTTLTPSLNLSDSMYIYATGYSILCNTEGMCGFSRVFKTTGRNKIAVGVRKLSVARPTVSGGITGTVFDPSGLEVSACGKEI